MSNNSLHSDSHPNKPTYELTSIKQNITTSHSVLRIIYLKNYLLQHPAIILQPDISKHFIYQKHSKCGIQLKHYFIETFCNLTSINLSKNKFLKNKTYCKLREFFQQECWQHHMYAKSTNWNWKNKCSEAVSLLSNFLLVSSRLLIFPWRCSSTSRKQNFHQNIACGQSRQLPEQKEHPSRKVFSIIYIKITYQLRFSVSEQVKFHFACGG